MLRIPNVVQIDVPPWSPKSLAEPVIISHWHADHWAGLRDPGRARTARLYSPSLQHALLLMTAFKMANVVRYSRPGRFPMRLGSVTVHYIPVIHTFEAYNYLVVLNQFKTAILYTADLRRMPARSLEYVVKKVEEADVEKLVVLADATYFSGNSVKPPQDRVVDISWVAMRAYNMPVVMPVLSTGRWASVLKLLEEVGYTGPVYMTGRSLVTVYSVVKPFKQRLHDREYYPVRTRVPVSLVEGNAAASMVESGVPGIYMVSGGMVQSRLAQRLTNIALRRGYPVVLSASQLPGTPGAELLKRGAVFKINHPKLHGHMTPVEWRDLLAEMADNVPAEVIPAPIHTTDEGAARFSEMAREMGFYVPRYEVLDAGGIPVISMRVATAQIMSGIAPEEPEDWKNGRAVLKYRAVYDPIRGRLVRV